MYGELCTALIISLLEDGVVIARKAKAENEAKAAAKAARGTGASKAEANAAAAVAERGVFADQGPVSEAALMLRARAHACKVGLTYAVHRHKRTCVCVCVCDNLAIVSHACSGQIAMLKTVDEVGYEFWLIRA